VVVDLSLNTGGYDFLARAIAGRFAAARTLAYTMRAGDAPGAAPYRMHVHPATGRRFTGPVYVLTSDMTSSAGEIAVLCLRTQPHVRHVGEPTRGGLSTVLSKPLPNGWRLSLSNEVFADHRGEVWEGRGIPPDHRLPVFDLQDPMHGHVEAVRRILNMIGSTAP
jgi:carboxyl-terminal processing protease